MAGTCKKRAFALRPHGPALPHHGPRICLPRELLPARQHVADSEDDSELNFWSERQREGPSAGKPWDQPTKALSVLSQAGQTASDISKLRRAGKSVESRFG